MRLSHLFGQVLRNVPQDIETESHRLLLRAAYVRPLASGIFSLLPLGLRSVRKIESIIREEMNGIGGQELNLPVVHPAELWKETGRWHEIGEELLRFKDRFGRDMVLGMTHEEVVADLTRREVQSYRQLPMLVYQIQTKYRDEPRARAGLLRVREFVMKDSYSLDADQAGLERQYEAHYHAYYRIFARMGLRNIVAVKSDTGMMGGKVAHEFMFLSEIGEDTIAICDNCKYSSNLQVAQFRKPSPPAEGLLPLERVATPETTTIERLASRLAIPSARTGKAVFYAAAVPAAPGSSDTREVVIMALVRGDMEVNEAKLAKATGARWLKPAAVASILEVGAVPGYASPVGLDDPRLLVVVDDLVQASPNLVVGANAEGFHLRNANYGRDYQAHVVADIASAFAGAACPQCGQPLRLTRGVELGNIFQLGTRYSEAMGAVFLDETGHQHPIIMGSYGIGVGRTLACIAEACRDSRGLIMPISVAPFDVHFVQLATGTEGENIRALADALYDELRAAGVDTLFDDRDVSPGSKFADADLIGVPVRLTLSPRSIKDGGVELKRRDQEQGTVVPRAEAVSAVRKVLTELRREIAPPAPPSPPGC